MKDKLKMFLKDKGMNLALWLMEKEGEVFNYLEFRFGEFAYPHKVLSLYWFIEDQLHKIFFCCYEGSRAEIRDALDADWGKLEHYSPFQQSLIKAFGLEKNLDQEAI